MDEIDRLIRNKILEDKKTIEIYKIRGVEGLMPALIQIYFLGFVPSEEALSPITKLVELKDFNQFRLEHTPENLFQFYIPMVGWTAEEIALALKSVWEEQDFNVIVKEK